MLSRTTATWSSSCPATASRAECGCLQAILLSVTVLCKRCLLLLAQTTCV